MNQQQAQQKDKSPQQQQDSNTMRLMDVRKDIDSEIVRNLLNKPNKGKKEYKIIQAAIEGLTIFNQHKHLLSTNTIEGLSSFKHEYYSRSEKIYNIGDIGRKFYIILKGSVCCLIQSENKNQEINVFSSVGPQTFCDWKKDFSAEITQARQGLGLAALQQEEYKIKVSYPGMKIRQIIYQGETFGEISLITGECRGETMVCREDTHLMVIEKDQFIKIFGNFFYKVVGEKIEFLRKYPFFRELPETNLLQIINGMQTKYYTANQEIYSEVDECEQIYLVKKGEVQISKYYRVKECELNSFQNQQLQQKKKEVKRIPINLLGGGSYFGGEELIKGEKKRDAQAVCYSPNSEIIIISKTDFLNSLQERKEVANKCNKTIGDQQASSDSDRNGQELKNNSCCFITQNNNNFLGASNNNCNNTFLADSCIVDKKSPQLQYRKRILQPRAHSIEKSQLQNPQNEDIEQKTQNQQFINPSYLSPKMAISRQRNQSSQNLQEMSKTQGVHGRNFIKFAEQWSDINERQEQLLNKLCNNQVQKPNQELSMPGTNPGDIFKVPESQIFTSPRRMNVFESCLGKSIQSQQPPSPMNPGNSSQKKRIITLRYNKSQQNLNSLQVPQDDSMNSKRKCNFYSQNSDASDNNNNNNNDDSLQHRKIEFGCNKSNNNSNQNISISKQDEKDNSTSMQKHHNLQSNSSYSKGSFSSENDDSYSDPMLQIKRILPQQLQQLGQQANQNKSDQKISQENIKLNNSSSNGEIKVEVNNSSNTNIAATTTTSNQNKKLDIGKIANFIKEKKQVSKADMKGVRLKKQDLMKNHKKKESPIVSEMKIMCENMDSKAISNNYNLIQEKKEQNHEQSNQSNIQNQQHQQAQIDEENESNQKNQHILYLPNQANYLNLQASTVFQSSDDNTNISSNTNNYLNLKSSTVFHSQQNNYLNLQQSVVFEDTKNALINNKIKPHTEKKQINIPLTDSCVKLDKQD